MCAAHVDVYCNGGDNARIEQIQKLEIQSVTITSSPIMILNSSNAITKRRKIASTLRKPLGKKYRSKNYNVC